MKATSNGIEYNADFEDLNQLQLLNNRLNLDNKGRLNVELNEKEYMQFIGQLKETKFEFAESDRDYLNINGVGKIKLL